LEWGSSDYRHKAFFGVPFREFRDPNVGNIATQY
jgi:hypothetical protein